MGCVCNYRSGQCGSRNFNATFPACYWTYLEGNCIWRYFFFPFFQIFSIYNIAKCCSMFQGWKSKESIPGLVLKYLDRKLMLDEFISYKLPFESINEGFELLHLGKRYKPLLFFYIYIHY